MISRSLLRARSAALALAVPLLLAGCSSGTDAAAPAGPSSAPASSAVPGLSPSAAGTPAAAARALAVTVSGGKVTGDTGSVAVEVGEQVAVTVTSDVADEVHVHGADVSQDVEAGGTVTVTFAEPAPGRFEVELENSRITLLRLQVG